MTTNQKTIVFAGVNASYSHTMLSYGHIRAYTEEFCPDFEWKYIETNINDDQESYTQRLYELAPDIVMATVYLFNQEFIVKIMQRLKRLLPKTRIYLGGPQFLGHNEVFLRRYPEINGVFRGDESSNHIIINGGDTAPGYCCIDTDGNYIDAGDVACFAGKLDALPSPYEKGYYLTGKPFYQLETSRGCGGQCTFCTSSRSRGVSTFSLERVRSDLNILCRNGARELRIVDRTFNEDRQRAMALLTMFRDDFPEIRFHLEINPARLTEDLLLMLASFDPGRLHLEAGVQTFKPGSLKAIRRPASSGKTATGLKQLLELGNIEIHADLIAGLPLLSYDDVLQDIKTLIDIEPHEIQLENLKLLPGTALESAPHEGMKWNPQPPYEIIETANMSFAELQRARYLSKMIDSFYNVASLHNLFVYACRNIDNFLEEFLEHIIAASDPLTKCRPQKRLELLESFAAKSGHNRLAELVKFVWLANGMSAEKYGIKVHKLGPDHQLPDNAIVLNENDQPPKRYFHAEFTFDPTGLLHSSSPELPPTPCKLKFSLIHGQKLHSISP